MAKFSSTKSSTKAPVKVSKGAKPKKKVQTQNKKALKSAVLTSSVSNPRRSTRIQQNAPEFGFQDLDDHMKIVRQNQHVDKSMQKIFDGAEDDDTAPEVSLWTCTECQKRNADDESFCLGCNTRRHASPNAPTTWGSAFLAKHTQGWKCSTCTSRNDEAAKKCVVCDIDRA